MSASSISPTSISLHYICFCPGVAIPPIALQLLSLNTCSLLQCIFTLIAEHISARLWIEDLFSQSTYVRMWWVTLRNVTRNVITYHRYRPAIYAGICASHSLTHSDTLDSDIDCRRQRSMTMEAKVGDDVAVGPVRLGYYEHRTTPTAKVTRAMRASPAPHIQRVRVACALARGKYVHAYS